MTIVDRIRESGRRKGKREGVQQGIQQGIHQGKQEEALRIAHTMLEQGIEREMVLMITGLSDEEIKQSAIKLFPFPPGHRDYQRR